MKTTYTNNVIHFNGIPTQDEDIPVTEFYKLLLAECEETGFPTAYNTDVTRHDKATLYAENPRNFIWILREHGSHLIQYQEQVEFIEYHLDNTPKCFYYYGSYNPLGGHKLQAIPAGKILDCVKNLPKYENE
jgi:hypothetical protein